MKRSATLLFAVVALTTLLVGCWWIPEAPTAHFTMEPSIGITPFLVRFDASASVSSSGGSLQYAWDFGDGSTGTGMTPGHLYGSEEITEFTVTLTVTDRSGGEGSATGIVTVYPIPPPSPVAVEFVWPFHFDASGEDAANLNDEYFALQNTGTAEADLSGWTVENERGVRYTFPNGFTLPVGASVYVHSGSGADSTGILYWGSAEPIWHNTTDIAILRNAAGDIVDVYAYGAC